MGRFLGSVVAMGLVASSAMAAQTYQLKCRPGPQTQMNLSVAGELRFAFNRGNAAAGPTGNGLRPGECAWVDRAVGPGEPAMVTTKITDTFKVGVVVPHISNNSFKAYAYASNRDWVYNFLTKDTILTVYAFNEGGTAMRVPNP